MRVPGTRDVPNLEPGALVRVLSLFVEPDALVRVLSFLEMESNQ